MLLGDMPRSDASAIIKDEARCIRCAQCADRCPAGAITMERFSFADGFALQTLSPKVKEEEDSSERKTA